MKLKAILADNAYLLKIVFRHARGYAALTVCTAILIAADNVAANALMPRYLTDALARRAPLREICSVLALMAALLCEGGRRVSIVAALPLVAAAAAGCLSGAFGVAAVARALLLPLTALFIWQAQVRRLGGFVTAAAAGAAAVACLYGMVCLPGVLELFADQEKAGRFITPPNGRTSVLLGEDMENPMPGLCVMGKRYLAGGGLTGAIALLGPVRMPFEQLIPILEYYALKLGECMAGKAQEDNT